MEGDLLCATVSSAGCPSSSMAGSSAGSSAGSLVCPEAESSNSCSSSEDSKSRGSSLTRGAIVAGQGRWWNLVGLANEEDCCKEMKHGVAVAVAVSRVGGKVCRFVMEAGERMEAPLWPLCGGMREWEKGKQQPQFQEWKGDRRWWALSEGWRLVLGPTTASRLRGRRKTGRTSAEGKGRRVRVRTGKRCDNGINNPEEGTEGRKAKYRQCGKWRRNWSSSGWW